MNRSVISVRPSTSTTYELQLLTYREILVTYTIDCSKLHKGDAVEREEPTVLYNKTTFLFVALVV